MGGFLLAVVVVALLWWFWESSHRKTHPVAPGLQADISLPYEQEFELYHNALSLCSMKTRVCLAELGVPYASHPIDLVETGSYETLSREFLKVNPGGTVPVLVHRGHPVYESHEQIRYAAAHAPEGSPSLVPADPAQRAEMESWIDRSSITKDPIREGDLSAGNAVPGLTLPLFAAMIDQIGYGKILEGLLFHFDKKRPVMFLLFKFRGLAKLPSMTPFVKMIARSRRQMGEHLDALEAQLERSGGPWILGEQYTLADVGWLVIVHRLVQADSLQLFLGEGKHPECTTWWHRVIARPSYREAILEHSHPSIAYGTERLQKGKAADLAMRVALEGSGGGGSSRVSRRSWLPKAK